MLFRNAAMRTDKFIEFISNVLGYNYRFHFLAKNYSYQSYQRLSGRQFFILELATRNRSKHSVSLHNRNQANEQRKTSNCDPDILCWRRL